MNLYKNLMLLLILIWTIPVFSVDIYKNSLSLEYHAEKYLPYTWDITKNTLYGARGTIVKEIKNNDITYWKLKYSRSFFNDNYGVKLSYFNMSMSDAHYGQYYYGCYYEGTSECQNRIYYNNEVPVNRISRTDLGLGLYRYIHLKRLTLGLGFGLRKLDLKENYEYWFSYYKERSAFLSPQASLTANMAITEKFSIDMLYHYYYATGKRYLKHTISGYRDVFGSDKTRIRINGNELDLALRYNYDKRLSFSVGYNLNYIYMKYTNYSNDPLDDYQNFSRVLAIRQNEVRDILDGVYLGTNILF